MKQEMISYLSTCDTEIMDLCKFLYDNPEDSYDESKSSKYICDLLEKHDFSVEHNFLNLNTAFYASKGNGHPKICFLCEYDAVPKEGHITAHNALSTISYGAAIALGKVIDKLGSGSVIIIGCPGEYVGGSKDLMIKEGVFKDIDVIMTSHPDTSTCESGTSSAVIPLSVEFTGNDGLSFLNEAPYTSLDALLLTFNTLNALSKGFCKDVEINSILSKGGTTPLLVPKECEAKFYIRANNIKLAEAAEQKIKDIATFVGNLMNVDYKSSLYQFPSEELLTNRTLNRLYNHNLKECGIIDICPPKDVNASLSIGTLSKHVPVIHPYISITEDNTIKYGTKEFRDATITDYAYEQYKKSALALAFTGLDLLTNEVLLREVKKEFFDNIK